MLYKLLLFFFKKFLNFSFERCVIFDLAHLDLEFSAIGNSFDVLKKMLSKFYNGLFLWPITIVGKHEIEVMEYGFAFFSKRDVLFYKRDVLAKRLYFIDCRIDEDSWIADGCLADHDAVKIS
jgi:hypothetical protein